jgi:two-component system chemotaxis response regulator CheB
VDPENNSLRRDIVVVGGSSGAFEAVKFIADLPVDFPAAIFLVIHISAKGPGILPHIIRSYSKLPTENARDGETISHGRIYVAPPDHHLSIRQGIIEVARGPKENRHRPSIDVLFRSAAKVYGRRVIGVILSGMLDDGSAGMFAVRARGGLGIVQDPDDALSPDMPSNVLSYAGADHCVPRSQLALLLSNAVSDKIDDGSLELVGQERREDQISGVVMNRKDLGDAEPSSPTGFSCPDCGGVLRRIENGQPLRFRCRVGHAYSGETLFAAQSDTIEEALWNAVRLMEEKAEMAQKLRKYSVSRKFKSASKKFEEQARKLDADSKIIRELLKSAEGANL